MPFAHQMLTAAGIVALAGAHVALGADDQNIEDRPAPALRAPAARAPVMRDRAVKPVAFKTILPGEENFGDWPAAATTLLAPLDAAPLLAEDALANEAGTPLRVGIERSMPEGFVTPVGAGQWLQAGEGAVVWRMRVDASNAKGVRLHIENFDLPEGSALVIGTPAGDRLQRYTDRGPNLNNEFWSGVTFGPEVVIEYQGPADAPPPMFRITEVAHLYRDVMPERHEAQPRGATPTQTTTSCPVRVNCAPEPVDQIARDSVGRMLFQRNGQSLVCTGCLLNDLDPNTFAGWFLSAQHCLSTQTQANTLNVLWFYEYANCSGTNANTGGSTVGSTLINESVNTDFTLLRLRDDPTLGQGFSAWTTDLPSGGSSVKMIHHPGGNPKEFTSGNLTTAAPFCSGFPTSRFWYWDEWVGETQGGSSGSPLFNENWEVVAQLFGVCSFTGTEPNCKNQSQWNSLGGRFDQTFPSISDELTQPIPDDSFEDNDVSSEAATPGAGSHDLRLVDFDDWFSFEVCENTDISVTTTFDNTEMRQIVRLFDESLNQLDADGSSGGTKLVEATVGPGTYLVRVQKTQFWGGDYTLVINSGEDADGNGVPDACEASACPADLNGSGMVDAQDLAALLGFWGEAEGDINGDGVVGPQDLAALLGAWGACDS